MKMHIEPGIKVKTTALLCMSANTDMFDSIIDDIVCDEGYEHAMPPSLLPVDKLYDVMYELGIPDGKVWRVTEIDDELLSEMVEELSASGGFPGMNMEDLIIHYVALKLLTGQWRNPLD